MVLWAKFTLAGLGLTGAGLGLSMWFHRIRWNTTTNHLVDKLIHAIPRGDARTVSFKDFEHLPEPVARYFRSVLKEGQPFVRVARISHAGDFRARPDGAWNSFESQQSFSAEPPGFVWDAGIHMAPVVKVRVRDAYVSGKASMQGKILSLVPVVNQHGNAELTAGALQRYLAESVWFPTALLPRECLEWRAIDNSSAQATLTDAATTVSLEFHFNDTGEITRVFTPGRYREVNGKYELTPWAGYFRNYQERNGMRIPVEADVEWCLTGENFPYWRGRIVTIDYDFAR